jgi:hypothetical protein
MATTAGRSITTLSVEESLATTTAGGALTYLRTAEADRM